MADVGQWLVAAKEKLLAELTALWLDTKERIQQNTLHSSLPPPSHVLRVNQLDARRLDSEISSLLRQQFSDIFALWRPGILERIQPELDALLQAFIWRYSIWIDAPTPGGRLQNLCQAHANSRGMTITKLHRLQKVAFLLLHVVFPWLGSRLEEAAQAMESPASGVLSGDTVSTRLLRRRFISWPLAAVRWYSRKIAPRVFAAYSVCAAVNFLLFLRTGTFSTLGDRLLGIRLMHIDPMAHRQMAFEYMNRVMIWNGLSEFLITVMPLVNLARARRFLSRKLFPKAALKQMEDSAQQACGLCGASPVNLPMRSDCGHVFCYFCIASEKLENPKGVPCPHCSSRIVSFEAYRAGDKHVR